MKINLIIFELFLKILTLFNKITSKNQFWPNVSLVWKSANSLISFLNTTWVVLSRNIGPKTWYPFGLLIRISTTEYIKHGMDRTVIILSEDRTFVLIQVLSRVQELHILAIRWTNHLDKPSKSKVPKVFNDSFSLQRAWI